MALDDYYQKSFSFSGIGQLQLLRHIVQLVVFLFTNGKIIGLFSTVLLVPYLHSTQAPYSTVIGAYDAVEYNLAHGIFPLLALGVIYLTGVTVGRVFCGWACPMGMFQDFISYLPIKKQRIPTSTANSFRDVKWAVVAFSVIVSVLIGFRRNALEGDAEEVSLGVFSDSPFSVISPSATLFTYIPWMILWKSNILGTIASLGWFKFAVFIGCVAPALYVPRFFCRFICPLGALLEPLSKYKYLRINKHSKLTKEELNKTLADICPMGVQIQNEESDFIDHPGCVHCGRCVTELPKQLEQKVL